MSLLVTTISCTETANRIKIPFGIWTQVGSRNHVLVGGPDPLRRDNFGGHLVAHCKYMEYLVCDGYSQRGCSDVASCCQYFIHQLVVIILVIFVNVCQF